MMASGDAHVDALAARLGRPLSIGAEGTLELSFEDGVAVTLEWISDDTLYLYGVMGRAPVDAQALRLLLEAHFFGRIADHIRFAIDPASGDLLLMERIDLPDLPPHGMPGVVDAFLAEVRRWRESEPWLRRAEAEPMAAQENGSTGFSASDTAHRPGADFPALRV